jgi:hypothetical protein
MLGSSKRGVGGLGIMPRKERVQIIFKKLFWNFLDGGGRNSPRRAQLFGMRERMEGENEGKGVGMREGGTWG